MREVLPSYVCRVFGLVTQPGAASKSASKSQRHRKGEHVSVRRADTDGDTCWSSMSCQLCLSGVDD